MKWNLMPLLNVDFYQKIRHSFGCKNDRWESNGVVSMTVDEIDILGDVYTVPADAIPLDVIPKQFVNSIFVACVGDQLFLVNTEGHSYCRYIAKVEIM